MATIGLREFWDSLDHNQLMYVLLVHKYELIQQLTDEKDKYLCVFTVCAIEEELERLKMSKSTFHEPLTLSLSSDGIYDLTVPTGNPDMEFAQCFHGEFLVSQSAMDRAFRDSDPHQALLPVNFSTDKICLRCMDMLTYPRPVHKFKIIVERQVMHSDLRNLLAADVGINEEDLVLMIRGKEIPREKNMHLYELGIKDNQQVVISKRLGTPYTPSSQTVDWSRQIVKDLLFGQNSFQEQKVYTVAKLVNVTQGYQLLPLLLERRVIQKVMALYEEDQKARAHEAELIQLLEMEEKGRHEDEERKRKKKQKKRTKGKEKEKDREKHKEKAPKQQEQTARAQRPDVDPMPSKQSSSLQLQVEGDSSVTAPTTTNESASETKMEEQHAAAVNQSHLRATFCVSCGASLDAGHRFCWQCGAPAHQPSEPVVAQGAGKPARRKRKNKKSGDHQPAGISSAEQHHNAALKEQQPDTGARTSRLPSAETDEDSGCSPPADLGILEEMYQQGRPNSRTASMDELLLAAALGREPRKNTSRLPFFRQLT